MEREFHDNVLRIRDGESDVELQLPALQNLLIRGPLRPIRESKTWSASLLAD
jgi:hypothetical protein